MRSLSFFAVLSAVLSAVPGGAAACAVCFGKATPGTQGLLDGIWWGIAILLSATMCMVGGIAWFLYKVEKSRLAHEAQG